MTGEVHNALYKQRRLWSALSQSRSVIAAVAVCGAMYSVTAPVLQAAAQQSGVDGESELNSRAPVIRAKPEHVTVTDGNGRTEIEWDTGSGSIGFVFVTENGGKPVLFAKSARGHEIAPWIKKRSYLFELFGDDHRKTLLGKVTVSGSETATSQRTLSWQIVGRWTLSLD